jgi:peptidyl-prolyl cis-trans isomerase B (cyclophilin B)
MSNLLQTSLPKVGEPVVCLVTTQGDICLRLFPQFAPKAVQNFLGLVKFGYYDNVIFHRVIANFMIQTGDPTGTGIGGQSFWGEPFADEFDYRLKHIRGTVSMANSGPATNGSQFFIVQAESTPWLDSKHTIFGQVFAGLEVVDKIATLPTDEQDRPITSCWIEKAVVETYES